jgi:uncharacterized membrane protein YphA (DoxX/SURF4 family)
VELVLAITVWIVSALLAAVYLVSGIRKLRLTHVGAKVTQAWVADITPGTFRLIAVVEIVGAVALIVPVATGIVPFFAVMAAAGLTILQGVAIAVHVNHREYSVLKINIALLLMAAFVAIARLAGV